MSSFTPRKVGMSVWGTIASFSHNLICSFKVDKEKGGEFVFSDGHLKIPVLSPFINTIDGFLDPISCGGGMFRL